MRKRRGRALLQGFDHVDLRFRNLAAARRFFEQGLGMDLLGEGEDHVFLLQGDQVLGLRRARRGDSLRGVDHLALRVMSARGVTDRLRRNGIVVRRTKRREDSISWFLQGPEGLRVELVHRPHPHRHPLHPPPPGVVGMGSG